MTILPVTPAFADTSNPDSTPTVEINAYRNIIETGDMLFFLYANIPYGSTPDTPVTQTFIWSLIDTDNTTELGNTVGSNFNEDGYGYNVYGMYFDAANVTAKGMTWLDTFTVRLVGNPAVFDSPPVYNYPIGATDYSAETISTNVKVEIAARVIFIADDLFAKWGLNQATKLVDELEAGTALSLQGQAFFRGAIRGIQSMAPTAFPNVIRDFTIIDRTWDPEFAENLTAQWGGTWVDTAQAAGQAFFGVEYNLLDIIILLGMGFGLIIANIQLTGDHWNGLVDAAIILVIGARLGMFDLGFLMLIGFICWFYIGGKVWFQMIRTG